MSNSRNMNSQRNAFNLTTLMMRIIVFLGFISLFSFVTVAEESHDQFDELAAINQPQARLQQLAAVSA
ncbi:hypothetical protein L3081_00300 [Colwellia sp. MSW7]|uniref:Methyl-accepting chemotaxis protein n=1 Tax=Colwellia maritima TaxID=2912588 RepID=A0ABS9WW13_9GAMM|nr:hypothetical protein [Colwellia maritima]MCI2282123.1 hypothetical protein [Colwellia maritima]